MNVVLSWLRLDLPRRWRSLVVMTVLIAVAAGTVMTALAGARRTASAIERLESRTRPATTAILANTPNLDWGRIRALPEVEAYTTFGPTFPIEGTGRGDGIEAEPLMQPGAMDTIERPVIQKGRMFDPSRPDEGIVPPGFLAQHHLRLGDTLYVRLPTPAELRAAVAAGNAPDQLTGPRVGIRVVGVSVARWFGDVLAISPGLAARYPNSIVGDSGDPDRPLYGNALFRLRGGAAAIPAFRRDVARVTGRSDLEALDLTQWVDHPVQQQATFAARCLVAFGLAALLAALVLVGQAVARYAAASATELRTLRTLGMSRRQAVTAATAGPLAAAVAGGVVAAGVAVGCSGWFPIGVARRAEGTPGARPDWTVLGPGLAATALLAAAGAAGAAALALRTAPRGVGARRSAVARLVARAGLPVPAVVGARFALETGRGRTAVPVRPALVGAVTGVLGVVAVFTFSHGVTDVAGHPERFGQTFQLAGDVGNAGQDYGPTAALLSALNATPRVDGVEDAHVGVATGPDGNGSVTVYSYSGGRKPLPVVVTAGRMPQAPDEIALAPQAMKNVHTHVGGRLTLTGSAGAGSAGAGSAGAGSAGGAGPGNGGAGTRTFIVTGSALVPNGYHNTYADGAWLTDAGYGTLFTGYKFHTVYLSLRPDARNPNAGAQLAKALGAVDPDLGAYMFTPPEPLAQVTGLRDVRKLPIILGLFLALLAVGAVGHALATAVRRRARDLAVLRALGLTQRQCRWVVVSHATVLAVIGLVVGVPLGVALGHTVCHAVADYTPFEYVPPVAFWTLLIVGPGALVTANVLAAWPGERAARLRVAQILRSE